MPACNQDVMGDIGFFIITVVGWRGKAGDGSLRSGILRLEVIRRSEKVRGRRGCGNQKATQSATGLHRFTHTKAESR